MQDFVYDYSEAPEGTYAIWPVTRKGVPCVWRLIPSRLAKDWEKGYIKIVPQNPGKTKNLFNAECKFFNKKSVQIVEANSHISG